MTKTIAELWNGSLEPSAYSTNPEMRHLDQLILRNYEKLSQSLSPAQQKLLENYATCFYEYFTVATEQSFCDGFCLGTKLTAEGMTGSHYFV